MSKRTTVTTTSGYHNFQTAGHLPYVEAVREARLYFERLGVTVDDMSPDLVTVQHHTGYAAGSIAADVHPDGWQPPEPPQPEPQPSPEMTWKI